MTGHLIQSQAARNGFLRKAVCFEMQEQHGEAERTRWGAGSLLCAVFGWQNSTTQAEDPKTILVIRLTTAWWEWVWRTDGGVKQGLPLRISLGSLSPILG